MKRLVACQMHILICLGIFIAAAHSASLDRICDSWPSYRNNQLLRDWNIALEQYEIHSEQVEYINNLLREVRDDSYWLRSKDALILGELASTLRTAADAVFDIISIIPGASTPVGVAKDVAMKGVDSFKEGSALGTIVSGMAQETAYSIARSAGLSPLGKSALAAKNLATNIGNIVDLKDQQDSLKSEVYRVSSMFERQLAGYAIKMKHSRERIRVINEFKNAIDGVCNDAARPALASGFAGHWTGLVNNNSAEFQIDINGGNVSGFYKQSGHASNSIEAANLSETTLQFDNYYENWACTGKCTIKWTLNLVSKNAIQGTWRNGSMSGSFSMQRQ